VAEELQAHPEAAIVYSDEDLIDERGRRFGPYFKPDFSPDLFLSHNLISHLGVYRRSLLVELGGFRVGFEGSQDYDLALRVSEKVKPEQIRHVPEVLYHWRAIRGSAARAPDEKSYAEQAARRALQDHLDRLRQPATIEAGPAPGLYRAVYRLPEPAPLVSIVIPTRDALPLLRACVESIRARTDHPRYEILVVDNQSSEAATVAYLAGLEQSGAARVLRHPEPFNFSAINNRAAAEARGEVLAFLNNDVEVISPGWLRELSSQAVRPGVGAAGARLLYPDGRVQHAGIVLGMGPDGIAGTPHRGFPRTALGYCNRAVILQNFSAVSAACLVLRKSVFAEAGGFDADNLPVAYNDVDLCLRLRERGHRIVFTPYAELFHKESATRGDDLSPERRERFLAEAAYMRRRWGALLLDDPYFNPNLSLSSDAFLLADPPRGRAPGKPG
jgi:GT2 family glycosyltransferase